MTQIVGCEWEDAHGSDGTIAAHEIDHRPYVFTTVGFLVRSDTVGVSIAFEQGMDGKFRDITFIPRKMVLREFDIYPKKRKKVRGGAARTARESHKLEVEGSNPSPASNNEKESD